MANILHHLDKPNDKVRDFPLLPRLPIQKHCHEDNLGLVVFFSGKTKIAGWKNPTMSGCISYLEKGGFPACHVTFTGGVMDRCGGIFEVGDDVEV